MQRNLFSYIWRHSRPEQIVILILVVFAQVFYFLSLTVPKSIVNNGISGNAFKDQAIIQWGAIDFRLPDFLGGFHVHLFDGFTVDQLTYLVAMSFVFLAAVVVNGQFKKSINTQKGRMGERMLRRLRYELYDRILRFPPAHFRKVKQAELATMVKDEVEPLGGFIGDAFVQPMFLGGQALTAIIFIMMQNWLLSIIVIVLLAVQMAIIPRLRRPVLVLGRQRQLSARLLAGRIAETADGVNEIHIHGAANYERADISERLGHIFRIRFELYNKKFVAKFWNNFLSQVTPFAIYLVGGYFAITGQMDVGAVVGVLLAYKDLPSPIKELIDWDQQRQDVQIKYEQVIDQFQPEGMMAPELQVIPEGPPPPLGHELVLAGVTVSEDGRVKLLDSISLSLPTDTRVAVIGGSGSGKDVLGQVLSRLVLPTGGSIKLDGQDFLQVPEYVMGARTAYIGQETYLFPLSVRDNLLFGLKHRPVVPASYDTATQAIREAFWREAERAGNPPLDPTADWIDYELAGATGPDDLLPCMVRALKHVEFDEDIYSARPARRDRRQQASRPRREDPEGAARAARPAAGPGLCRAGRAVQRRQVQQEPVGRREPAVRHAGRQGLRRRQPRRRSLHADGDEAARARPRPAAHGPQHRRDHGRAVLRPVARQSAVRAVQLHLGRRAAQRPPAAAAAGRQGRRRRARGRPRPADDPAAALHRGAPSPRPDRRRYGRPPAGGAARLRGQPARRRCAARSSSTISSATTAPPRCRTTFFSAA